MKLKTYSRAGRLLKFNHLGWLKIVGLGYNEREWPPSQHVTVASRAEFIRLKRAIKHNEFYYTAKRWNRYQLCYNPASRSVFVGCKEFKLRSVNHMIAISDRIARKNRRKS